MSYHLTRRGFLTLCGSLALSSIPSHEMFPQQSGSGENVQRAEKFLHRNIFSKKKPASLPDYRQYVETLERLLNKGQVEAAYQLIQSAQQVPVPMTSAALQQLTNSFSSRYEVSYLLFAGEDGTIDTLFEPPQQAYQFGSRAAVHIRFSDEDIVPIEQRGKVFVGDYHSHRRTKEEILALQQDQVEQARALLTRYPNAKYELFDNTAPSSGDVEERFKSVECNSPEDCQLLQRLRQQQKVTFIGGLNTRTLQFEIRAFNYLTYASPQLAVTEQGHRTAQLLDEKYRAIHGKYLRCVEFHVETK